ncbi:Anosmin-1, partial [Paragonimus heterotremus]
TGDSPSGWSCLTGCRILDAALKERSGECPPQGGPAIHRLPGLLSTDHLDLWSRPSTDQNLKQSLLTGSDASGQSESRWHSGSAQLLNQAEMNRCTVDAECPNRRDKCCQSQCKNAAFREDILPPIPTVRILESKAPVSFLLSWEHGSPILDSKTHVPSPVNNNLTEPIVYVLQVKTYFGPEFDSRLANNWKTLVMSTLTGAQLSEPRIGWWYQFQVAAVNRRGSLGFELPSPPVKLSNLNPSPPSPPRDLSDGVLTMHANGEIRVQIRWSPPVTISIPVTEYRIYWGLDSPRSPEEPDFSEKPTQFVHTVPATELTYQLSNLMSDSLYRVQVLAMCEWGPTQLRSLPSHLFIRTPATNHLHSTRRPGLHAQIPFGPGSWMSSDQKPDITSFGSKTSSEAIGQSEQCICDGRSRMHVLRATSISLSSSAAFDQEQPPTYLEMQADQAVFDGREVRMRVQLSERYSTLLSGQQLVATPRLVHLQWTPQVCIETQSMDDLGFSSLSASPTDKSTQQSDKQLRPQTLVPLPLQPNPGNRTVIRLGETHLTDLHLNCRYLVEVFSRMVDDANPVRTEVTPKVELRACLCTPACSGLATAPWVPKLECKETAERAIPEPQKLSHRLVRATPLSYNISWLPGDSQPQVPRNAVEAGTKSDEKFDQTNVEIQKSSRSRFRFGKSVEDDIRPAHYRVVWGPSQDKPINPSLWKLWPGLRPRLDPSRAETKVLRNGETSLLIGPLLSATQYVVKVQAISSDSPFGHEDHSPSSVKSSHRIGSQSNQMSMRSSSYEVFKYYPATSKDVYLYFETPMTTAALYALDGDHTKLSSNTDQKSFASTQLDYRKRTILIPLLITQIYQRFQ